MGRKIDVDGPAGKTEVTGSYDPESRTVSTDDGKKIHLGNNDRATVHPECFVATAVYGRTRFAKFNDSGNSEIPFSSGLS